jgi:hypothetical protein
MSKLFFVVERPVDMHRSENGPAYYYHHTEYDIVRRDSQRVVRTGVSPHIVDDICRMLNDQIEALHA